jgi:hypothetical protein
LNGTCWLIPSDFKKRSADGRGSGMNGGGGGGNHKPAGGAKPAATATFFFVSRLEIVSESQTYICLFVCLGGE